MRNKLTALVILFSLQNLFAVTNFQQIHGFEPHFVLPPNESIKNIKTDFKAVGDGVTDDTKAFQDWITSGFRKIYIPEGTYLIKDQIRFKDGMKRCLIIGEQRSKTILKLADNSPGFNDHSKPKAFIHTRALNQQGEQNMCNFVYHITIEIGKGNPGAVGLNFHTSNTGMVRDVAIRATDPINNKGLQGIAFDDYWFGPGCARYVEVDGFTSGVYIGSAQNHTTLEHFTVSNCKTALFNGPNGVSLRSLTVNNCDTVIKNAGPLVALDISATGGKGANAIYNTGFLTLRNVSCTGYSAILQGVSGTKLNEYVTPKANSLWAISDPNYQMLNLPIENGPEIQYPQSASEWKVLPISDNLSTTMQQTIDAGAKYIFCQGGTFSTTVKLNNKVQYIMGLGVTICNFNTGTNPVFRLESGTPPFCTVEFLHANYGSTATYAFELTSPRTLVIRSGTPNATNTQAAANGKVFIESCGGYPVKFTKLNVWMRDINTEIGGDNKPNIVNDGGTMWIMGQKCEDYATKLSTLNGGYTELLGGTYRQNWDAADGVDALLDNNPLFVITNANASLTFSSWSTAAASPQYKYIVRETRGSETRNLTNKTFGGTADGIQSLYVGYDKKSTKIHNKVVTVNSHLPGRTFIKRLNFNSKSKILGITVVNQKTGKNYSVSGSILK